MNEPAPPVPTPSVPTPPPGERVAAEVLAECLAAEQSVRRVVDDTEAEQLRGEVRRLARAQGVRLRTARLGDTVVVVRLDAAVWHASTEVMREKLSLPPEDD